MAYLGLRMSLHQKLAMPFGNAVSLMGLSALELELVLDRSLGQVAQPRDSSKVASDSSGTGGNYFLSGSFREICRSVRGSVSSEKHLENPAIYVEHGENGYFAGYNPDLCARIAEKLEKFTRKEPAPTEAIFSKAFGKGWNYIQAKQSEIAKISCDLQQKYIQTWNPFDLKPITQEYVAGIIGNHFSTVSKLINNLTVRLPDGLVIFVDELIPGSRVLGLQTKYALGQLQDDPVLYKDGVWEVSDNQLVPILKERFGLILARRTVNKHRLLLVAP